MKKRVKYLLSFILLLAVLSPLSALAKGGEAEFTVSEENKNKATLSLTVEKGIAENMTSLRLRLLVEVTEGEMAPPLVGDKARSKFEFSSNIKSEVQDLGINQTQEGDYIIDIIISGTESIFANGVDEAGHDPQTEKKKVEIGTLTLSASGENGQFSAAVSLLPEQDPAGNSGSEVVLDEDRNVETFDTAPILEYVEDNGIQAEELRMTNANTVTLSGGRTKTESEKQSEIESESKRESESQRQSEIESESKRESESQKQSEEESQRQSEIESESKRESELESQKQPGTEASGGNAKPEETEAPPSVNPPVIIPPEESETQSEMPSETMPPEETETQSETTSQEETEKQTETTSPDETEQTEEQTETATPGETALFDPTASPERTLSRPLFGSGYVHFSWTAIEKAVGYEVRQVLNGKNVLLATVSADDGTEYEQEFDYNTRVRFKVRAYGLDENGKKVYGKYGAAKTIRRNALSR